MHQLSFANRWILHVPTFVREGPGFVCTSVCSSRLSKLLAMQLAARSRRKLEVADAHAASSRGNDGETSRDVCCFAALTRPLLGRFLPIFTDFSDFLGRLQPSKTTTRKTLNTLGVEERSFISKKHYISTVVTPLEVE